MQAKSEYHIFLLLLLFPKAVKIAGMSQNRKIVGVALNEREMAALDEVIARIVSRSNGLADPSISAVVKELAGFAAPRLVSSADRSLIRGLWQPAEGEPDPNFDWANANDAEILKEVRRLGLKVRDIYVIPEDGKDMRRLDPKESRRRRASGRLHLSDLARGQK